MNIIKNVPIEEKLHIESFRSPLDRILAPNFFFSGEKHNFWEIVYVDSGEFEIAEENMVYHLGKGDIIFHAPMEFHTLRRLDNENPRIYNLSFYAQGAMPKNLTEGVFSLSADQRSEFLKLFRMATRFISGEETDPFFAQELTARITVFILNLCRHNHTADRIYTSNSALTYKALIELMDSEVLSNLSLQEFAERSFISVSYIKSLFARYAGISPKSYYAGLRLHEAQRLLENGMSVNAIAEKMNFSSPNYFILFFKKHMGVTPPTI